MCALAIVLALPGLAVAGASESTRAKARVVSLDPDELAPGRVEIELAETAAKAGAVAVRTAGEVIARGAAAVERDGTRAGRLDLAGGTRVTLTVAAASKTESEPVLVPVALEVRGPGLAVDAETASVRITVPERADEQPVAVGATFAVPAGAEPGVYHAALEVEREAVQPLLVDF